jgi:hypothetical protein
MATATIGYDNEMPCDKLARLIAKRLRPELWTRKQMQVAIACIKYLAYGTDSDKAQRHTLASRLRFIHLDATQNDILLCAYMDVEMDDPELVAQAAAERELYRDVRDVFQSIA